MGSTELENLLIEHLDAIDSEVGKLDSQSCYAFGASCLERLAPVHARAASDSAAKEAVEQAISRLWTWLRTGVEIDWAELSDEVQEHAELGEAVSSAEEAAEFFIANAVADFLGSIADDDPQYARFAAARNIDTIELLADELPEEDLSTLFSQEIERQERDLRLLEQGPSETVETLEKESTGVSVLGDCWFP